MNMLTTIVYHHQSQEPMSLTAAVRGWLTDDVVIQECRNCGEMLRPNERMCPNCGSTEIAEFNVS